MRHDRGSARRGPTTGGWLGLLAVCLAVGLDGAALRNLVRALEEQRAAGVSLVIVTQDPRLLQLVDRIVLLNAGSISRIGTPQEMGRAVSPLRPVGTPADQSRASDAATRATAG